MKTVFAAFDEKENAKFAIQCLKNAGYKTKNITIVMRDPLISEKIAVPENDMNIGIGHATVTGLTTGAVVGGLAGLLIAVGAIAIPGIGGVLIAGPLAVALGLTGAAAATASGAVTGAVTGGLLGVIMGFGLPREQAKTYERRVQQGALLLAVPALDDQEPDVLQILQEHDATDIKSVIIPIDFPQRSPTQYDTYGVPPYQGYSTVGVKGGKRNTLSKHIQDFHLNSSTPTGNSNEERIIEKKPEVDIQ